MIAACLICRNSEQTIERTLNSIRPWVDEINVFDTGSTDGTVPLLRQLNRKKMLRGPGPDGNQMRVPLAPIRVKKARPQEVPASSDGLLADFSWARERSFEMASPECDWLFWLDDDDFVVGAEHLRGLALRAHHAIDGYVFFYDYARDSETSQNTCALWRERLLRRKDPAEWGWRNAVHEVWLPHEHTGITPNYVMVPAQQVRFVHERPEGRYANTRNLVILEGVVERAEAAGEQPDPRTLCYMGTELMAQTRFAEAIPWFQRYLEHPGAEIGDERSQVHHKLGICLRALGQPGAAVHAEFQAVRERDDWAENAIGLCEAFSELGEWARVETWARRALDLGMPQSMLILNPLEFTLVPRVRLAQALAEQHRFEEAVQYVGEAAQIMPQHPMVMEAAARVEKDGTRERIVQALLTLREMLVRFDENEKAYHLFDSVPYIVEHDPRVVSAKAMQTEMVMHLLKPDEYRRWYEDEPKEAGHTDEQVEAVGDELTRVQLLLDVARKFEAEHGRKPRMLDLGCNDGWMGAYLWTHGEFVCDGVELNRAAAAHGAERMERFGCPARIVQGDILDAPKLLRWNDNDGQGVYYDIVSCFEVFEHVPDTTRLLGVIEGLLSPDGIACLTTPNGAFEDGNLPMWSIVERKGHLRAVTFLELAETLQARGEIVDLNVHANNALTFAAWKPASKKGRVVLYAPGAYERWSPTQIRTKGIGGSETCLSHVAVGLAERGWDVRVFADAEPGFYVGSVWRPAAAFDPTMEADAVIVSRAPHAFDVEIHAPVRALWCHDATYMDALTERRAARMTDVVTLSEWSAEAFLEQYPFLADKVRIIRNGVALESMGREPEPRFPYGHAGFDERKPMCIYSSSADRGLDKLLEVWPAIRAAVPTAELHVFYGWETFDQIARHRPELFHFKARIMALLEQAGGEAGGVFMRGRVGQDELYEAMQQARVWSYPTYFTETSCIGAMEARAAGMAILTSELAALTETVGEHGILLEVDEDGRPDDAYMDLFVGVATNLLSDEETWQRWHDRSRAGIEECAWPRRLDDWENLIVGNRLTADMRSLIAG